MTGFKVIVYMMLLIGMLFCAGKAIEYAPISESAKWFCGAVALFFAGSFVSHMTDGSGIS